MYIKAQIYSRSQIIFQNWRIALEYSATYSQELDNPKIHQQPMTGDYGNEKICETKKKLHKWIDKKHVKNFECQNVFYKNKLSDASFL